MIADPLDAADRGSIPTTCRAEEQVRRERMRETASGVTTFATDRAVTVVAFPLAGRLFVAGLISGVARELVVDGPVFDPRPDPCGQPAGLRVRCAPCGSPSSTEAAGSWRATTIPTCRGDRPTTSPARSSIGTAATGGAPMARRSPHAGSTSRPSSDGTSPIRRRPTNNHARCATRRRAHRTPRSSCTCWPSTAASIEVAWDRDRFPYLTAVHWVSDERLLLTRPVPRPARPPGVGGQPDDRRHRADLLRSRRPLGRAGAGNSRRARRRATW